MSLDFVLLTFTFSAGIIAFLNPCGFIMLPAYISSHMEKTFQLRNQKDTVTTKNHKSLFSMRKLGYGFLVGLVTTSGFITIFLVVGIGISYIGIRIVKLFPWIAFASAMLIIGIGIAKLSGKSIYINIPASKFFLKNNEMHSGLKKIDYRYFFVFGIGYAIISLNCTLPLFLFLISQGISAGGLAQGSVIFLTYALGMGTVMTIISALVGISNQTFTKLYATKLAKHMNVITSVILILAGIYLVYYSLIAGKLMVV
jgi:cytochrome c-type biogenesis protein